MSFSPDPQKTGWTPSTNRNPMDATSAPPSQGWIFAQPGGVPPGNEALPTQPLKPSRPRGPKKRLIWYIVAGVVVLCVVLGFVVRLPLNRGTLGGSPSSVFTPGAFNATNSRLFSNASPWNVAIGSNVQLDPNSSAMVSLLAADQHVPTLYRFGMPIYISTASDPTYTVDDDDSAFEAHQPIHIPDAAAPSTGSDHWLFVYDTTQHLIFEMWQAEKDGDTWTANTGDVYSPTGDGVLQADGSQQSGNGASYFGGVVTDADIARGSINHALSFATEFASSTWRYPMNASDGQGSDESDVPMGARLQLDPSVNCNALPGASSGEKMVCQALETYGGYIRDSGGVPLSIYFEGEDLHDPDRNPPLTPGDPGRPGGVFDKVGLHDGQDLSNIPWDKLRVLNAWNSFNPVSYAPFSPQAPLAHGLSQANATIACLTSEEAIDRRR